MLDAAYAMLAMLPVALWAGRVRDEVAVTASRPSVITESATSTIYPESQTGRAVNTGAATMVERLRARREQKRRESREFRAWLEITAKPLW